MEILYYGLVKDAVLLTIITEEIAKHVAVSFKYGGPDVLK